MFRKTSVLMVLLTFAVYSGPPRAFAENALRVENGQIRGFVQSPAGQFGSNTAVRVRNLDTGRLTGITRADASGHFAFADLDAGLYVVEALTAGGGISGTSAAISLAPGAMRAAGVALQAGAAPSGSFFTSPVGIAVLAAIAAGAVTAVVVATNDDESPSR